MVNLLQGMPMSLFHSLLLKRIKKKWIESNYSHCPNFILLWPSFSKRLPGTNVCTRLWRCSGEWKGGFHVCMLMTFRGLGFCPLGQWTWHSSYISGNPSWKFCGEWMQAGGISKPFYALPKAKLDSFIISATSTEYILKGNITKIVFFSVLVLNDCSAIFLEKNKDKFAVLLANKHQCLLCCWHHVTWREELNVIASSLRWSNRKEGGATETGNGGPLFIIRGGQA